MEWGLLLILLAYGELVGSKEYFLVEGSMWPMQLYVFSKNLWIDKRDFQYSI